MPHSVFISHSAHRDPPTKVFCEALMERLPKTDYQVFFDSDIQPTDKWRLRLATWLAQCDAAVLVLSREALSSPWVIFEASILKWRHYLNPGLPIFIVPLSPLTPQDVMDAVLPFQELANEIQMLNRDGDLTHDQLQEEVVRLLGKMGDPKPGPMKRLEDFITQQLNPVGESVYKEQLNELGAAIIAPEIVPYSRQLARQMLTIPLDKLGHTLGNLMGSLSLDAARAIIDALACFWVEPQAAATLADIAKDFKPERAVGINTRNPDIVDAYVRRAYCRLVMWPVARVTGVMGETGDELYAEVVSTLASTAGLRLENLQEDERALMINKYLEYRGVEKPFFIHITWNNPDSVNNLRKRFAGTFIVTDSWSSALTHETCKQHNIQWIEPALDKQREMDFIFSLADAYTLTGVTKNAGNH